MSEIFFLFLSLSLSGSLFALLLFLLKPAIKYRLSRTWQYYIFLSVILRLLLPFSFEANFVDRLFNQARNYIVTENEPADFSSFEHSIIPQPDKLPDEAANTNMTIPTPSQSNNKQQLLKWCWIAWIIPAVVLLFWKIISYLYFTHTVKAESEQIQNPHIMRVYEGICKEMHIRHIPEIVKNDQIATPMLVGIFRPVIILPDTNVKDSELSYILQHELTHYRRFDIVYKWLVQVAVCLHWYNPVVHWIKREINHNCELSCDEIVIKQLDKKSQRAYGDMLLETIKFNKSRSVVMPVTLSEDAKLIKERLDAIMKFQKKSKKNIFISAILAAIILCGTAFCGGVYFGKASSIPLDRSGLIGTAIRSYFEKISATPAEIEKPEVETFMSDILQSNQQKFVIEKVEMRQYEGDNGHPYIYEVSGNDTGKTITGYQRGMLAFDKDGNPLKIDWWSLDTDYKPEFYYLYSESSLNWISGQRDDKSGGFSLNFMGIDPEVKKIEYVLYCIKEITFEDGTVWSNPDYENWLKTYQGKKIDVDVLDNYYPCEQVITF